MQNYSNDKNELPLYGEYWLTLLLYLCIVELWLTRDWFEIVDRSLIEHIDDQLLMLAAILEAEHTDAVHLNLS